LIQLPLILVCEHEAGLAIYVPGLLILLFC